VIGKEISHYRILEKIGEGGMGVVYKAQDMKLDRAVALKFLPQHLTTSEPDKARFMQEAKAASAINHPNICTIYDIQELDGQLFIAMEYVTGQTLREQKENLSIKRVLDIGIQIADGLAAAHEQGIVHRDIKPENIMVRKDGLVQIMDFGLAKLRGATRLTKEGSTVGTVGYMSPELVQGLDADHRADIFSLGIVLYEMLAGELPFKGVHETAIMYEIVNVDPVPISSIRQDVDPNLDAIILECLAKEPEERYQSVKEVSKDLKRFKRETSRQRVSRVSTVRPTLQPPSGVAQVQQPAESLRKKSWLARKKLAWVAALVVVGVAGFVIARINTKPPELPLTYSSILPPEGNDFVNILGSNLAISPDGRTLTFAARDSVSQKTLLWVKPLNSLSALPLPGTEDAFYPFWSADSRYIGFFAQGKLKKIQATGGPPLTICDAAEGRGGTWNQKDIILFTPLSTGVIHKVSAAGGTSSALTALDSTYQDYTHRWPYFLPDGEHFLFFARSGGDAGSEKDAICLGSLNDKTIKRLIQAKSNPAYAQGHIIFAREATLMAQPFEAGSLQLTGDAMPIAEKMAYMVFRSQGVFSVSEKGVLVYQTGGSEAGSDLVIFNRAGQPVDTVGAKERYFSPRFSPDGRKIVVNLLDLPTRNEDIWVYDIARGIRTRFTFDPSVDYEPIWSRDESRIAFGSSRQPPGSELYLKGTTGVGIDTLILDSKFNLWPSDWSKDGRYLLYSSTDSSGKDDIWVLPLFGERKPFPFTQSSFSEYDASLSPDGRWLAYLSDESGKEEVYVAPFPGPGGKWQVSIAEGDRPRWRADGKELFYLDNSDRIMVAEVDGSGTDFKVGAVKPLFQTRPSRPGNVYDVSADGQKFLVNTVRTSESSAPFTLVQNWTKILEKK
jgi:serine/threonine protein kinase